MKPAKSFIVRWTIAGRHLRGTFDFAAIADRARMPWRFLERHIAVDALSAA
jgi:hypothetical protein